MHLDNLLRQRYGSLEFFSDIGGLFSAINPLCMTLVIILQYYGPYHFVMNELFGFRSKGNRKQPSKIEKEHEGLEIKSVCKYIKLNCQLFVSCSHSCCLRPNHKRRLIIKSYHHFLKEVDIV